MTEVPIILRKSFEKLKLSDYLCESEYVSNLERISHLRSKVVEYSDVDNLTPETIENYNKYSNDTLFNHDYRKKYHQRIIDDNLGIIALITSDLTTYGKMASYLIDDCSKEIFLHQNYLADDKYKLMDLRRWCKHCITEFIKDIKTLQRMIDITDSFNQLEKVK